MATAVVDEHAQLQERLRTDWPFFAEHCLKIVSKSGKLIPFVPNVAQIRLVEEIERMRTADLPIRLIILKARQLGFSTAAQGWCVWRITQTPNQSMLTIAQDRSTAGKLFRMAETMHRHLSEDPRLSVTEFHPGLKPPLVSRRRASSGRALLEFGTKERNARDAGDVGLNSTIETDTAQEFEAGRGLTIHKLHCSEAAFWPDLERKLSSLLEAVPDDPETAVFIESTANGFNTFKEYWDRAEDGTSDYAAIFAPWYEEPTYSRRFLSEDERAGFEATVGTGPFGDEEPDLIGRYDCTLEQLRWRRHKIDNNFKGDLKKFHQEYPTTSEQAFLATGQQVFSGILVSRLMAAAKDTPPKALGRLEPERMVTRSGRRGVVSVPTGAKWEDRNPLLEREPLWKVWEWPDRAVLVGNDCPYMPCERGCEWCHGTGKLVKDRPPSCYIIAVDPAKGDEADEQNNAFHAIEVINHRTKVQAAEYVSQEDPGEVAVQVVVAATFWNRGWLVPEVTGGWGLSIAKKAFQEWNYPFVYRRKKLDSTSERTEDRLGWETTRATKPLLEDGMRDALREDTHGIRSLELAREFTTYVRGKNGRSGPEAGSHADRLMAYMIGQQVAVEKPCPKWRRPGDVPSTSTGRRNPVTGYSSLRRN